MNDFEPAEAGRSNVANKVRGPAVRPSDCSRLHVMERLWETVGAFLGQRAADWTGGGGMRPGSIGGFTRPLTLT